MQGQILSMPTPLHSTYDKPFVNTFEVVLSRNPQSDPTEEARCVEETASSTTPLGSTLRSLRDCRPDPKSDGTAAGQWALEGGLSLLWEKGGQFLPIPLIPTVFQSQFSFGLAKSFVGRGGTIR